MHDPVVMISRQVEDLHYPVPKRIFSVRVFGPVHVEAQVHEHQQVTEVAKLEFFKSDKQENNKKEREGIFQKPVIYIGCAR